MMGWMNQYISLPSSTRHRWLADDGPTLNSGLVALRFLRRSRLVLLSIPKFCDFWEEVWTACSPPPLDLRMNYTVTLLLNYNSFARKYVIFVYAIINWL